jgi:hypothetical protein
MTDISILLEVFQCVAVVLAGGAIFFQWRSAKRAAEIAAYTSLIESYGKAEMRIALLYLADFGRDNDKNKTDYQDAFQKAIEENRDPAGDIIDKLRVVGVYFSSVSRLYSGGFISKKLTKILINHPGLNVYYKIVVPLNTSRYASQETERECAALKKVLDCYADGRV